VVTTRGLLVAGLRGSAKAAGTSIRNARCGHHALGFFDRVRIVDA
jgi:hypothetical protein